MLVQCPKCKTTYKVSDEIVKGTSPAFRCSRCKYTFELETTAPEEPLEGEPVAGEPSALKSSEERELSFTFPGKGDAEKAQDYAPGEGREPSPKESTAPEAPHVPTSAGGNQANQPWSMSGAPESHEKPFVMTPPPAEEKSPGATPAAQPSQVSAKETSSGQETGDVNIFPINSFREQAVSTVPYLTLFGLLIIFFSLATAYLEAHPRISENLVRQIPLIGPSLVRNNYLKNGVLLKSLRADYQTVQGNREVLVVSGEAVNQNPVIIRELRVVGRLYDRGGKTIERQVIWVGNALSPKIIRGMSVQDIADLQRLKPLKSFEVPPGDSISFAIVFLRPAKDVKDFGCEVLSAEGEI